ncbi:MAG: deaminase [Nanoarchaeota archaeon]|nr:deaminase [Nanoarchaeota archaeon]
MEFDANISDFKKKRDDWNEYFMKIAREVAKRSTCFAGTKHGAVAVKERQIIATGYNGAPRKTLDCYERGVCIRRQLGIPSGHRYELCRSVHAEMNVIINSARSGVSLVGAELYIYSLKSFDVEYIVINAAPCLICKKMLINAGISKVHGQMADGSIKTYDVAQWQKDWQEKDMLDDMDVYDSNYYKDKDASGKKVVKDKDDKDCGNCCGCS